jgi:transcriptional regulator with XRE-family HTH domain
MPRRMENEAAEIGRRIRSRRIELGLSQADLGQRAGIVYQQVHKYEVGVNSVPIARLRAIAEALECTVPWLLAVEPVIELSGRSRETVIAVRLYERLSEPRRLVVRQVMRALLNEPGTEEPVAQAAE